MNSIFQVANCRKSKVWVLMRRSTKRVIGLYRTRQEAEEALKTQMDYEANRARIIEGKMTYKEYVKAKRMMCPLVGLESDYDDFKRVEPDEEEEGEE